MEVKEWIDYGFVPRTPREVYLNHEPIPVEGLYYKNDEGEHVTPYDVWFSCDSRNWHQNPDCGPGRAMTIYGGKYGTTLTPVYLPDGTPYHRDDLCDCSAMYRDGVLCDFNNDW